MKSIGHLALLFHPRISEIVPLEIQSIVISQGANIQLGDGSLRVAVVVAVLQPEFLSVDSHVGFGSLVGTRVVSHPGGSQSEMFLSLGAPNAEVPRRSPTTAHDPHHVLLLEIVLLGGNHPFRVFGVFGSVGHLGQVPPPRTDPDDYEDQQEQNQGADHARPEYHYFGDVAGESRYCGC